MGKGSYKQFGFMIGLSFCIMYAVMFLNVDRVDHIYLSLTRLYMSLLMVSPMALLMLAFMGKMYPNKKLNTAIAISSLVVFGLAFSFLRNQTFISDKQYMQAMIPHHSSAILTSRQATLTNPEVKRLSEGIIQSQEREITRMKQLLDEAK